MTSDAICIFAETQLNAPQSDTVIVFCRVDLASSMTFLSTLAVGIEMDRQDAENIGIMEDSVLPS